MAAPWGFDIVKKAFRLGRRRGVPGRETDIYPRLLSVLAGQPVQRKLPVFKPTPWNLRTFTRNPYARRAINAIKNPIANQPWEVVVKKGITLNSELQRQIDIVSKCFSRPNLDDNWSTFVERVLEDVFCGAGCFEMQLGGDPERPLWMYPVDGLSIQMYPMWDGDPNSPKYCQVPGYGTIAGNVAGINLLASEICYIPPNPSTSTPFGVGPMEVAFMTISRAIGATEYAGNVASNARPVSILNIGKTTPENLEKFRQYWTNEIEGQGKTPIMGGEAAESINLYPEGDKSLFLGWQEFQKSEIAVAFDLSPQNLGVERDVNRNTAEVAEDRDWESAIKPNAKMFERKMNTDVIEGKLGFTQIEFRFVGLDREDEKARADIHKTYYDMNVLTPNEIREEIGREPSESEWADKHAADVQIAVIAARGVGQVIDEDLGSANGAKAKPSNKSAKGS